MGNNNNSNNNNNNSSSSWNWGNNSSSNNNNNNNSSWSWGNNSSSNNNNTSSSGWDWGNTNNNSNNNNNNNGWNWGNNNNSNNNNNNNLSWNFGNNNNNNNQNNNRNNPSFGNNQYDPNNPRSVMQRIFSEYNPHSNNPNCRFEAILYNKVPRNSTKYFEKPPWVRAQLWDQFVNNNPDKNNLVPVAVRGYEQLNERGRLCLAGHLSIIKSHSKIIEKINELKYNIEKKIKDKILELKQVQIDLSYRLLVIIKAYIILSQKQQQQQLQNVAMSQQGLTEQNKQMVAVISGLTNGEKEMKRRLDILTHETRKLHHLMANIDKSMMEIANESNFNKNRMDITVGTNVMIDDYNDIMDKPENAKMVFNFLSDQTKIISQLMKTVNKDLDDIEIIKGGIVSANHRVYL